MIIAKTERRFFVKGETHSETEAYDIAWIHFASILDALVLLDSPDVTEIAKQHRRITGINKREPGLNGPEAGSRGPLPQFNPDRVTVIVLNHPLLHIVGAIPRRRFYPEYTDDIGHTIQAIVQLVTERELHVPQASPG